MIRSSFADISRGCIQILEEHRKGDEKCYTDEIFYALDVLVEIHQSVNILYFDYAIEYLADHTLLLLRHAEEVSVRNLPFAVMVSLLGGPIDQPLDETDQEHDRRH